MLASVVGQLSELVTRWGSLKTLKVAEPDSTYLIWFKVLKLAAGCYVPLDSKTL